MKKILVINGPNLNLLGEREPAVYGDNSLEKINAKISDSAQALGFETDFSSRTARARLSTVCTRRGLTARA